MNTAHTQTFTHLLNRQFASRNIIFYVFDGFLYKFFVESCYSYFAWFRIYLAIKFLLAYIAHFYQFVNTQVKNIKVKWLCNIVVGTNRKSFNFVFFGSFCSENNKRNV